MSGTPESQMSEDVQNASHTIGIGLKKCSKCGEVKPISEFYKSPNKYKLGVNSKCKDCLRDYGRNYWHSVAKHKRIIKGRKSNYILEYFHQLKSQGSLQCSVCGESDLVALDFHHPLGAKGIRMSNLVSKGYSIERIKREMAKCIVLCSNCHRRVHGAGWKVNRA